MNPYTTPLDTDSLPSGISEKDRSFTAFYSPGDLADALIEFFTHTGLYKKSVLATYKIQICISAIFAVFYYIGSHSPVRALIGFAVTFAFSMALSFILIPFQKRTNKGVLEGRLRDDAGDIEYKFQDACLVMNRDHIRCEMDYEIFREIFIGKRFIHLVISDARVISFRKEEINDGLREFLAAKIPLSPGGAAR